MSGKIRWAKELGLECGEHFGAHCCCKDINHETDPTNDDHQCCCGETYDPRPAYTSRGSF
jgi:hypothetical protein